MAAFQISHRAQLAIRYLGVAIVGVVVFFFALQWTFPYNRVKERALDVLSEKYDASIAGIERGILPGHFALKGVTLRSRPDPKNATMTLDAKGVPQKVDEVPTTFYIDRIDIDVHLLALLRMTGAADLDIKIGNGHITGSVSASKSDLSIDITGESLPGSSLPLKDVLGLPMTGKLDFSVSLDLPSEENKAGKLASDWQKAEGEMSFSCPTGCTIGDGHTKLKPKLKNSRSQAFAGDGIDFGKVNLDSLIAKVEIKDGKMDVTKFETKSNDGELHVEFSATLAPVLDDSVVTGCLRFKGSESLMKSEPKTFAAIATTGAPLGPDGLYHIKLADKFKEVKRLPQVCGDAANTPMDEPGGNKPTARPGLPPPEPPKPLDKPSTAVTPPPPPPIPVTTAPVHTEGSAGSAAGSAGSAEGSAAAGSGEQGSAPAPEGAPQANP
jgi:type II secretion system protein N|nr:type II secretion system protein GspN [Kofleriaceae bacterium]